MTHFGRHICAAQNDKEKSLSFRLSAALPLFVISTKPDEVGRMEKSINQVS